MKILTKKFFLLTTFITILLLVLSCSTNDKTNILAEQQIETVSRIILIEPSKSPSFRYITDLNTLSSQPKWSPDKKLFAFISEKNNLKDLWISDIDGVYSKINNKNQLEVESFEWSPNSKEIAIQYESVDKSSNIFLYTLENENLLPITRSNKIAKLGTWSPDNKWITYTIDDSIYISNPKGVNEIYISEGENPKWSPNGEYIGFTRKENENTNLWIYKDIDKVIKEVGKEKQKTSNINEYIEKIHKDTNLNIIEFIWAYGGNKILYISDIENNNEIYIHEIKNSQNKRLTNNEVDEKNISWSEKNRSILFTSNAHGRADIYKMKGDGSDQVIILNSDENFNYLDW